MIGNQVVTTVWGRVCMVFQTFDVRCYPDEVNDALFIPIAPGIVGGKVIRLWRHLAGIGHNSSQRIKCRAVRRRIQIAAEDKGKAVGIDFPHLSDDHLNAIFLRLPGEAEMGIEIVEPAAGTVETE